MLIFISIIGLFIILGIYFSFGKGEFLIAGFNTMSEEEKAKYALCKFMGKMTFTLCFSMLFWVLSIMLDNNNLFLLGLFCF